MLRTLRTLKKFTSALPNTLPNARTNPLVPLLTTRTMSHNSMPSRLAGKTVLITGASSGIGRATALEFSRTAADNKISLILAARRIDTLKELKAEIETETAGRTKVLAVQLDVSDPTAVRGFLASLPEEWRKVDVLVNNAGGVRGVEKVGEIAEEDVQVMIDVNVIGLINLTQSVVRSWKSGADTPRGDVINIGSIAGREPYAGGSIYCATKAAVRSFSDALRKENIANRIRVIEIDPGQVETEFSLVRFRGDKEKSDAVYKGCDPLTPEDIAEVVVFTAGRRENVVVADVLVFPSHQAGAGVVHRRE